MRRTLFLIPHEIAGVSVFGLGWIFIALVVGLGIRLAWARRRGESIGSVIAGEGVMWAVAMAVVAFVLPRVELSNVAGEPVGMPIRGYGAMLLLGVGSAVVFAAYRVKARGVDPERIYALAPWTFIGGIVGARLFYVVQYYDRFVADTTLQTLRNMIAFTEGGLVVYGGFIGGFIASVYFIRKHRLPLLTLGDVIVPCMLLGVVFGRTGCLMNGCCYGGRCESSAFASIEFPPGSPVYRDQLDRGELVGIDADPNTGRVNQVSGIAEELGIEVGDRIERLEILDRYRDLTPPDRPADESRFGIRIGTSDRTFVLSPADLPARALPVRAAQVLSSLSALVLFVVLLVIERFTWRTGQLMFLGFAGYAVVRFSLEMVRVDEAGQFGTTLSISQWVSIVVLVCSVVGWTVVTRLPAESTDAARR